MPINQRALSLTTNFIPTIEQLLQQKDYTKAKTLAKKVYEAFEWYQQSVTNLTVQDFFTELQEYQTKDFDDLTFYMCLDTIIRILRIVTFDEADTWWQSTFQQTLEDQYIDIEPEQRIPAMLTLLKKAIQNNNPR